MSKYILEITIFIGVIMGLLGIVGYEMFINDGTKSIVQEKANNNDDDFSTVFLILPLMVLLVTTQARKGR